jgi:hypothetical protein
VQTFYQPVFSNSRLAILLQLSFPFQQSFSLPKSPTSKSQKQKPQSKNPPSSFSESFISSGKQGGAAIPQEQPNNIGTGKTCLLASLKINNLEEAAVLHFPLLWPRLCQSQPTDKHLRKSS